MISKLTQEKTSAIQQNQKLRQELVCILLLPHLELKRSNTHARAHTHTHESKGEVRMNKPEVMPV